MGRGVKARPEKVPKWSREQFADKFSAVERKLKARGTDSAGNKYADIDTSLKRLEQKIKEGSVLEQGRNKVSAMAAQLANKNQQELEKPQIQKSGSKAVLTLPAQGGSEICHFCNKRVYLMERLSAEGKFFHRGCFRCEYCSTTLRLGSYAFDRDGKYGSKFFCTNHFGFQGSQRMRARRAEELAKMGKENIPKTPQAAKISQHLQDVEMDALDRGTTPERVEFENLSGLGISDEEEANRAASEMDEDEWTDRNFGASAAEGSSDDISDLSDSEEDDDDTEADFAEALTADETLRLAENWTRRHSHAHQLDDVLEKDEKSHDLGLKDDDESTSCQDSDDSNGRFSYQEYDSEDDESDTATEGEEELRARELRKKEVELRVPERQISDSGSDTEVASDEYSESLDSDDDESDGSGDKVENSATEIETDSEFEHDGSRPEIPDIIISDVVQVRKGKLEAPQKVKMPIRPVNGKNTTDNKTSEPENVELKFTPLVPDKLDLDVRLISRTPIVNPNRGDYLLNRTHSTEGIASKISLELKKKYLLGTTNLSGSVRKSGSASTLDTRFKSFVDQISEQQKLLNPAPEPSPTMQAILQGADKLRLSPTLHTSPNQPFSVINKKEKELPKIGDFGHICSLKNNEQSDSSFNENCKIEGTGLKINKTEEIDPIKQTEESVKKSELKKSTVQFIDVNIKPEVQQKQNANENEGRPRSPVHETSIVVPDFPRLESNKIHNNEEEEGEEDMESDSLSSNMTSSSDEEDESDQNKSQNVQVAPPKVEIHNSKGELMDDDGIIVEQITKDVPELDSLNMSVPDICQNVNVANLKSSQSLVDVNSDSLSDNKVLDIDLVPKMNENNDINNFSTKIITVPSTKYDKSSTVGQVLKQVSTPAELFFSNENKNLDGKISGRSSPSSPISLRGDDSDGNRNDNTLAALTETELSDWARDEDGVSENFEDLEFNINPQFITFRKHQKPRNRRNVRGVAAKIARTEEFDDEFTHVCGKSDRIPTSNVLTNIDNIEFMDTGGEEESSTENALKNNINSGYVQFVNPTDDEDDLTTPIAENPPPITPYVRLTNEDSPKEDEESVNQNEDTTASISEAVTIKDSPLIEQNKLVTDNIITKNDSESNIKPISNPTYDEYVHRLQGRISPFCNAKDSIDIRKIKKLNKTDNTINKSQEIEEKEILVNKLNSDSNKINNIKLLNIDKSKSTSDILMVNKSPETRKLEEISRERSKQKDIIHDMVMNKLLAQRKSPSDRKNKRNSRGSSSPLTNQGSQNSIVSNQTNDDKLTPSNSINSVSTPPSSPGIKLSLSLNVTDSNDRPKSIASPEDVILKFNDTLKRRHSVHQSPPLVETKNTALVDKVEEFKTPVENKNDETIFFTPSETPFRNVTNSIHSSIKNLDKLKNEDSSKILLNTPLTHYEVNSLPDMRKALFDSGSILRTPLLPNSNKLAYSERCLSSAILKENARKKAQMKTDEELGLSPEDRIKKLKEKMYLKRKNKSEDILSSNCTKTPLFAAVKISQPDVSSQSLRDHHTKDLSADDLQAASSNFKGSKLDKKKYKDRDRRKSIIQAVSDFFLKKSPTSPTKTSPNSPPSSQGSGSKFSKFRIHRKDKSKSANNSDYEEYFSDGGKVSLLPGRTKSLSESEARRQLIDNAPPIPPPPVNYVPPPSRQSEDSYSEADDDSKATTLHDGGTDTPGGILKKTGRTSRRLARQAQLKRLRMAHEIQRQLEEVEVKQKDLEARGVLIEKAIRGECNDEKDETELTRQWLDLMRERNELRRYEHELTVRAQDVELEETHSRLQQELRERLAKDDTEKSPEEVAKEGQILREMLQIVERRDDLHALLEEEHQRYKEEAKDLEAQMLAKGLRLTSVTNTESNI